MARMLKVYERKCSHQLQLFFLPALVLARVAVFLARASRPCSVTLEGSTRLPVWVVLVAKRTLRPLMLEVLVR